MNSFLLSMAHRLTVYWYCRLILLILYLYIQNEFIHVLFTTCTGQFLRKDVKIDDNKRILLLSNKNPVPVKQRQVWGYMKQEMAAEGKLCWAAVRPGEQGEGLIDGTYMDYRVKDIFSNDFKFKPRKHHVK